ncbi:MAG: hypothetical protein ACK4E3_03560 [Brevundimonas sp.]|uniref:hypothetical protein n=1 Tax=Brevundimonas sp. TaxID=1871086 RepID=UPI00391A81D2
MAGSPLKRAKQAAKVPPEIEATRPDLSKSPHTPDNPAQPSTDTFATILDLARHGFSTTEIAAYFAVPEETMTEDWPETHPELKAVLRLARTREKAWWLSQPRLAITHDNNRFAVGPWSHVMRSRYPEFADLPPINTAINIGSLVRINRVHPDDLVRMVEQLGESVSRQLIRDQMAVSPKVLTDKGTVQPGASWTPENEAETRE